MVDNDLPVGDLVANDMHGIFAGHMLADYRPIEGETVVSRGFTAPTGRLTVAKPSGRTLAKWLVPVATLLFFADVSQYSTANLSADNVEPLKPLALSASKTPDASSTFPGDTEALKPIPQVATLKPASPPDIRGKPIARSNEQATETGPKLRHAVFQAHQGDDKEKAKLKQKPKLAEAARPLQPAIICGSRSAGSNCWAERLATADNSLFTAYYDAVDANVPRTQLRDYRKRWWSARRSSREDPAATIRGFDELSARLREAALLARSSQGQSND